MKPIKFKEQNCTYAENQDEYGNLPAFKDENGVVISCWKLSFKERVRILFYGNMWLSLLSFNKPLTPSLMTTDKSDLFLPNKKQDEKTVNKGVKLFKKLRNQQK
jgi:hypothetical protein